MMPRQAAAHSSVVQMVSVRVVVLPVSVDWEADCTVTLVRSHRAHLAATLSEFDSLKSVAVMLTLRLPCIANVRVVTPWHAGEMYDGDSAKTTAA